LVSKALRVKRVYLEQQVPLAQPELAVSLEFRVAPDLLELLDHREVQGSQETEGRLDRLGPQVHKDKLAHRAVKDRQD
jgi:hypothetical protein